MTKVAILIPSHIRYKGQIPLLDNCISSLLEQTLKPNSIYISISFENDTYKADFERILQKYGSIQTPYIHFEISKEKKFQMEHLHHLSSYINDNDYDILMFCDDDDTYHHERVARFVHAFNAAGKGIEKFGGVREHHVLSENPEYWCYGIVPNLIRDFFNFFKGKHYTLLQDKFGDMYFRQYLCKNSKYDIWVGIIDARLGFPLYNYNIYNPHSICGKVQLEGNIYDNLLLKTIECNSDSNFDNIINAYKDIYNINKNTIDSMKTIYDFCKLLYK